MLINFFRVWCVDISLHRIEILISHDDFNLFSFYDFFILIKNNVNFHSETDKIFRKTCTSALEIHIHAIFMLLERYYAYLLVESYIFDMSIAVDNLTGIKS